MLSAFGLALLAAALLGAVSWLVGMDKIASFDLRIISVVQGWETPGLTRWMKGFSWVGATLPTTALSVLSVLFLYFGLRHRYEVLFFIFNIGGSTILNRVLKGVFRRERPDIHRLAEELSYSFPSGHAMAAVSLYGALAYLLWRHIPSTAGRTLLIAISAFMIGMISISRIYLGVHYPSDVIGGLLGSGMWLALTVWIFGRWARRRERSGKAAE